MHVYFSGIGGTGLGPLALIAKEAGINVSGSDKQDSEYIQYLRKRGISLQIGQSYESIEAIHSNNPIDWFVYSSALPMENPNHPELRFCKDMNIKTSKRDEFLNYFIEKNKLKMIAIAGTHGKTTTTAMVVWLFKQLDIPISYSVGGKLSFGDMGEYDPKSEYFAYEADEFDRNFLTFKPFISIISGIDYDHPDIYPTREEYYESFREFVTKSAMTFIWEDDAAKIGVSSSNKIAVLEKMDYEHIANHLAGRVNRENAQIVAQSVFSLDESQNIMKFSEILNKFPGVSRRFERLAPNIYTDYAHTPEKIRGALQMAHEVAGDNVVVVYEGLHNTRQHFIKDELSHLFDSAKKLYVVPSYLAREDKSLKTLSPQDIIDLTSNPKLGVASNKDQDLKKAITHHQESGDLVLCLTAGGGNSLDEWLRKELLKKPTES